MKFFINKFNSLTEKYRFLLVGTFSFIFLLLIFSPLSNPIKSTFQQDKLITQNKAYLSGTEKTDRKVLIQLAEIDALLAVLQSGEVGISFIVDLQVKVGQSLSTFSKFINKSLEMTIVSIIATATLSVLLDLSEYLSKILLITLLVSVCLLCFSRVIGIESKSEKTIESTFIEIVALLFLSVYLLVPYSIHGAAFIEDVIFSGMMTERNTNINNLHKSFTQGEQSVSFKNKAKNDFKKFEQIAVDVTEKIENTMTYYVEHFIHIIFRAILIPLGVFALLFYFLKKFLIPSIKRSIASIVLDLSTSTAEATEEAKTTAKKTSMQADASVTDPILSNAVSDSVPNRIRRNNRNPRRKS